MAKIDPSFCQGCPDKNIENLPNCIITEILQGCSLQDLISNSGSLSENLVCPKAAQDFNDGKLTINSSCSGCELCKICCNKITSHDAYNQKLEKLLLSDLSKLNIFFKHTFKSYSVGSEIQVSGNSRTKRIDLVLIKDNHIFLVKTLKDTDKINFYSRSYSDAIDSLKDSSSYSFEKIILIPANADILKNKEPGVLSIPDFINYLRGK